jgi:hypothetical protein
VVEEGWGDYWAKLMNYLTKFQQQTFQQQTFQQQTFQQQTLYNL